MRRIEKSPKQKSPEWKKDICLKNKTQKNVKLVKKLQNKNDYNLELVLRIFFSFLRLHFFYMIHESTHLVTDTQRNRSSTRYRKKRAIERRTHKPYSI